MKEFQLFFLILIFFTACKGDAPKADTSSIEDDYIFTVATDMDHAVKDTTGNYFEMRCEYYGNLNFIIDDSSRIYFYAHKRVPKWICIPDTIVTPIPPPEFINLQPHQIYRLPENGIEAFVKANLPSEETPNYIVVSSAKDTFKSAPLYKALKLMDNNDLCIFRRMTYEEKTVLKFKQSRELYFADDIDWDTTQVRFIKEQVR